MRSSARLKRLQVDGATSYAMRRHVGLEPAHLLLHHLAHLCDRVVARPRCALHLLHGEAMPNGRPNSLCAARPHECAFQHGPGTAA